MPLSNDDLFVVQRGSSLFKVPSSTLKSDYSSTAQVYVGDNPPANPVEGDLWWSSVENNLFIWYDDGSSQQWVDASPAFVDLDYDRIEAYIDQYVDDNAVGQIVAGNYININPSTGQGEQVTINADLSGIENSIVDINTTLDDHEDRITALEEGGGPTPTPPTESISTPTVLTPPDGAGIGGDTTYTPKTSAITNVSGSTLTLTNSNTYNNADGSAMAAAISQTFLAGQTVTGVVGTGGTDSSAFSTTLYTGNGTTQTIDVSANAENSLLWFKRRNAQGDHLLVDAVRGYDNGLSTNSTIAEFYQPNLVTAVNDTEITIGNNAFLNSDASDYVVWNFRAAPGFLDIVTYTGDDTDKSYAHSLGTKPGCMIVKNTNNTLNWQVYHQDLGYEYPLMLNTSGGIQSGPVTTVFSAEPTASEFSVGGGFLNAAGYEYIAYLFADTPGKIKCGSFTGLTTIDLGFRLGWILFKSSSANANWIICDSARGFESPSNSPGLFPNVANQESEAYPIEVTDTTATINTSNSETFIYVAIAEDVVAGEFGPTGTLTADADDNGPTISLTDVTGTWEAGMEVVSNTEITEFAPGADVLEFTSTTPSGTNITTYGQATWQVDTDANFSSPMTATKAIADGTTQELLPSERGAIVLDDDTTYNIRVKYDAADPSGVQSAYSDVNQFQTAGPTGQDGWNAVTPPEANMWLSVTYGDGKFVAVAGNGDNEVIYSTDGINWTAASAPQNNGWKSVTYGDGKFVAVGYGGLSPAMYSTDGINWTATAAATGDYWTSVTYGDGKFLAVSSDGDNRVMYSPTGEDGTWTNAGVTGVESNSWTSVTYGGGKFVAVGTSGDKRVMYSTNGINWTSASATEPNNWLSVTYGDGKFVAISYDRTNRVMYSPTGEDGTWTNENVTGVESNSWNSVTYGDGKFLAVSSDGTNQIMYSANGINWTPVAAPDDGAWQSVTYGGSKFVAVANFAGSAGNQIMWSETGVGDPAIFIAYDADNNKSVNDLDIVARYGVDPTADNTSLGIYELTEQPTTQVQGYIRSGDKYKPIRDFTSALEEAQSTIDSFETRIAALEADHTTLMNNNGGSSSGY